jgi:hypothetical protein
MRRADPRTLTGIILVLVLTATQASAQSEVGTVAAVQGTVRLERSGTTQNVSIGVPVFVGDRLTTGTSDRARIVFEDDSVLDIGPETEVVIDTLVFERSANRFETLLKLLRGTIRSLVSEYYREPRASYEIETPTAVVGVRGTEFITRYYPTADVSEIVGIVGEVTVTGRLAVIGAGVQVGPQFYTQVRKGGFPTTPERLSDTRFQQYLEAVEILGTGRRDGLSILHPLVIGRLASAQDTPQGAVGVEATRGRAPRGFLADRLSQDVYTNTQPLLDYKNTPPGQVPPGSVTVHY